MCADLENATSVMTDSQSSKVLLTTARWFVQGHRSERRLQVL